MSDEVRTLSRLNWGLLMVGLSDSASVVRTHIRAVLDWNPSLVKESPIKWAISESRELLAVPHIAKGVEISRAVISRRAPVKTTGQADIAGVGGQIFEALGIVFE